MKSTVSERKFLKCVLDSMMDICYCKYNSGTIVLNIVQYMNIVISMDMSATSCRQDQPNFQTETIHTYMSLCQKVVSATLPLFRQAQFFPMQNVLPNTRLILNFILVRDNRDRYSCLRRHCFVEKNKIINMFNENLLSEIGTVQVTENKLPMRRSQPFCETWTAYFW